MPIQVREIRADEQSRDILNTVIYSTLLKGFAQSKQPERVQMVFEEMKAERVRCRDFAPRWRSRHGRSQYKCASASKQEEHAVACAPRIPGPTNHAQDFAVACALRGGPDGLQSV